jgi:hypothetical protein
MKTKIITILVIAILFIVGYMYYQKDPAVSPVVPGRNDDSTFCTADVKECSDGSYVSRSGPDCQFAECPKATN